MGNKKLVRTLGAATIVSHDVFESVGLMSGNCGDVACYSRKCGESHGQQTNAGNRLRRAGRANELALYRIFRQTRKKYAMIRPFFLRSLPRAGSCVAPSHT